MKTVVPWNKTWLIKEVAKRAKFTQSDTRTVLNTMMDVIYDLIEQRFEDLKEQDVDKVDVLRFSGLFSIYLRRRKAHMGWHGFDQQKPLWMPDSYGIVFVTPLILENMMHKNGTEALYQDDDNFDYFNDTTSSKEDLKEDL